MKLASKRTTVPSLGGLPATRRGAVALALMCAIAAAVILVFAIGQYRTGLKTAAKQDTVLVATGRIQKGISGDVIASRGLFKPTPIQAQHLSIGALTDASAIRGKVAASDILPGQQLTIADFVTSSGFASQLGPNQRAVAVPLDTAHGLLDVLQAGDRVDIYGGFNVANSSGPNVPVNRMLIPNALVLKVPPASSNASGAVQGATVVLAVYNTQAPTLAFASDNGKVWFVLRPGNAAEANQDVTSLDAILFGIQPKLDPNGAGKTIKFSGSVTLATANATGGHP